MLTFQIFIFSYTLWLGFYLLERNPANPRLWLTGLGLVAYALALGIDLLVPYSLDPNLAGTLARLQGPLLFLPALCWAGVAIYLLPDDVPLRSRLIRGWAYSIIPGAIFFYFLGPGTGLILEFSTITPAYLFFAALILLPLLAAFVLAFQAFHKQRHKQTLGMLLVATLFFTLGAGLLLFPLFSWLPRAWVIWGLGFDLILLGFSIARLDAFEEGETLWPDFVRSFDFAFFSVLVFGGLVVLTIIFATGVTFPMLVLLLATIAVAIIRQTFSNQFETLLDKLAFAPSPHLRQARANLRVAASILPRVNDTLDLAALDEAEFARLTRRALSHFGDLPRLAASPLTHLPIVEAKLAERGLAGDSLERAAELKAVLAESIDRLKPRDKGDFGTSDEWRYYNALYFPYVVGLKPYSRRADHNGLDPVTHEALAWFRTSVPERTLYNWQSVAAQLVAKDLRERWPGK